MRKLKVMCKAFFTLLALLLFSSMTLAVSFSDGPIVTPTNATTQTSLECQFTPSGTGTLNANITWWYNDGSWNAYTADDETIAVTNGIQATSSSVSSANTAKDEQWLCQVGLYNETTVVYANATAVIIQNSAPVVTFPTSNQTVYEDTPFSLQALASDPDGDSIIDWISSDLNKSNYGDLELFDIASNGQISFTVPTDFFAGNHTMLIGAVDTSWDFRGIALNFEVFAVNDPPNATSDETFVCDESSWCNFSLSVNDEENNTLVFEANESFINMNASGFASFIPVFEEVGLHTVAYNVTDGNSYSFGTFNLTINTINHIPSFNYNSSNSSSGIQNQSGEFLFYINATDIDVADEVFFSVETFCGKNPWNITTLVNGSGGLNASAVINATFDATTGFIPNDFVECRDITIIANDGKENAYVNFTLNITNTNDPPSIFNYSAYPENGFQTNMSFISSAKGLAFGFKVNATDIDNLTYEGESWNFSLYGHDPGKFQINSSTGLISSLSVMDDTYVGNYSFLVIVTDDEGLSSNETVNISIINNTAPEIEPIDNSSCTEDVPCIKAIVARDAEANIYNSTTFSLTYIPPKIVNGSLTYDTANKIVYDDIQVKTLYVDYINYNATSVEYRFNITGNDSDVGLYLLNVTFSDLFSATSFANVTFNITNVNDVPLLDNDVSPVTADTIVLFPIVINNLFTKTIYALDDDLTYGLNNLTFNYSLEAGSNITANFNLTKNSERSAVLSFYPNTTHLGVHRINFTVSDGAGGSDLQEINFTVYEPSIPPNITQIRPYAIGVNATIHSLVSTASYPSPSTVYVSEGDSLTFEIVATDADSSLQNLTLHWYYEGLEEKTSNYVSSKDYTKSFNLFSSGTRTVLLNLTDELNSYATYEWTVIVYDSNQPPVFLNPLANMTAAENTSVSGPQHFVDFFRLASPSDIVFLDPDDDVNGDFELNANETNTLTFSVNESGGCSSYATFEFTGGNLLLTPKTVGTCYTNFIANDSDGLSVSSNVIQIDILNLDSGQNSNSNTQTVTVTQRITIPLEEDVDVPKEFQLIIPGITTIYDNGTVIIPLRLKNTWDKVLTGISLSSNASVDGLTYSFSKTEIPFLPVNGVQQVNLTLRNYRLDAPFEVNISAKISSLDYTDVATVYVNALEKASESSESVKSKIGFARDLLSDNPECQELNELLDKAERTSESNKQDSLEMVNAVIRGCKYLINTENKVDVTTPESFLGKLGLYTNALIDVRALITVFLILTIGAVGIGIFTKFHLKKI